MSSSFTRIGQNLRRMGPIVFGRHPSTGKVQFYSYKSSSVEKQGKILQKLMTGGSRKKWCKDSFDSVERLRTTSLDFLKPKNTQVVRRVHVLNSVILQAVCDVMSTGELCPELSGLGLEITQVKVSQDFNSVNVYWTTSIAENTGPLEQKLPPYAGKLKNIMCGLNILGKVPYVQFIKDRHLQNAKDVEYALARADFGPDFVPTDKSHQQKLQLLAKFRMSEVTFCSQQSTSSSSSSLNDPIATTSNSRPKMRMDIFHLNHEEITDQIMRNMNRAKAAHRTSEGEIPTRIIQDHHHDDDDGEDVKRIAARLPEMPDTDVELRKLLKRNAKQTFRTQRELESTLSTYATPSSGDNHQPYDEDEQDEEVDKDTDDFYLEDYDGSEYDDHQLNDK